MPEKPVSYYYIEQFREQKNLFADVAAVRTGVPFNVTFQGDTNAKAERIFGQIISADYFSVLGVQPQLGRVLSPAEDKPGDAPVVIQGNRNSLCHCSRLAPANRAITKGRPPQQVESPRLARCQVAERRVERLKLLQACPRPVATHIVVSIGDIFFRISDGLGDHGGVDFRRWHGLFGQYRKSSRSHFREATPYDDTLRFAIAIDGEKPGFERRDIRRMAGKDTELAFLARNVDLADFACKYQAFGRDQLEAKCGHGE